MTDRTTEQREDLLTPVNTAAAEDAPVSADMDAPVDADVSPSEPANTSSERSIAKNALLMTAMTLCSRATGLIRTWAMAFALGNTVITSAFQVANNLPNLIFELVAGGLLAAAFIPVFMMVKEKDGEKGSSDFTNNVLNILIIVLGILSVLAAVFAPAVVATQTFTVGSGEEVTQYAIAFFRIFAIQILFYGIGGVITGILNANRIYGLPSFAPALNNVMCIIGFFAYVPLNRQNPELAFNFLAIMTSLGVFVQMVVQIPALKKTGYRWRPYINLRDPALIEAIKIAIPTLVYVIGTMVAFSCRNAFSLQAGDNGPSTLLYAWTWFQLPYGVVAVSLSRVLFTEMSEAAAKEDMTAFAYHTKTGISATLLLIIPLAGIIGALATSIMQIFQAGAFSYEDALYVGSILALWMVTLPCYSVVMYLYNTFASLRRFLVFAIVSCLMVVVQCVLYAVLCKPELLGLAGVPVADFVYYAACAIILMLILRKRIGSFGIRGILWNALRVLIATAIGVVVIVLVNNLLPTSATSGIVGGLISLVVCGSIGLIVIFGLCALFRVPEMHFLTDILKRFKR